MTPRTNKEEIIMLKNDIAWIKKMILGVFGGIILNIIINLISCKI